MNRNGERVRRRPAGGRLLRWMRVLAPAAVLLQLAACQGYNGELIRYQYLVGVRNLAVRLIGDALTAAL
ncbi:MAG: hypothetical protein HZB38_16810 [Planctomycetes bacterium]|nr:hypothetical protein [Planctomycetota bacterium]